MICTKKVSQTNVSVNQQAGSLYHSGDLSLGSFAQTFADVPTVNCTLVSGYAGFISALNGLTASDIGSIQIFRSASSTNLSYEIDVVAYGTYGQSQSQE